MVRGKRKRVTTVKKFNNGCVWTEPSAIAVCIGILYAILTIIFPRVFFNVEVFVNVSTAVIILFLGFSLFGAIREIVRKTHDFVFMGVGLIAISLLLLFSTRFTGTLGSIISALAAAVTSIVFSVIGISRYVQKKEGSQKIVLASLSIILGVILAITIAIGLVFAFALSGGLEITFLG